MLDDRMHVGAVVIHNIKIRKENRHQKTCWSITRISAGLHTSTLRVGEQDRIEQGSLSAHLSLRQRAVRKQLEGNTMYL